MTKTDFYDLLVDPRRGVPKQPKESPQEQPEAYSKIPEVDQAGSQNDVHRQASGKTIMLLTLLSVTALGLTGVLAYYFHDLSREQSVQTQSLQALQQRLDENGEQVAGLQSQLDVIMERLGVTQKDLEKAQARAVKLRASQAQKVKDMVLPQLEAHTKKIEALTQDMGKKADSETVSSLEKETARGFQGADQKISAISQDVKNNQQQLAQFLAQFVDLAKQVGRRGDEAGRTSAASSAPSSSR